MNVFKLVQEKIKSIESMRVDLKQDCDSYSKMSITLIAMKREYTTSLPERKKEIEAGANILWDGKEALKLEIQEKSLELTEFRDALLSVLREMDQKVQEVIHGTNSS